MDVSIEKDLGAQLLSMCEAESIQLTKAQAQKLVQYLQEVVAKSKQTNLTSITNISSGLWLHVLDSLYYVAVYEEFSEAGRFSEEFLDLPRSFVDIGTGGGFPGVPFGIVTGLSGNLVDSVGKKTRIVKDLVRQAGLAPRIQVHHERIEDYALSYPNEAGVVIARAVAPLEILVEYSSPLLKQGGILIASKGTPNAEELHNAKKAADMAGMIYVSRETRELPLQLGHREIYVYQKVQKPSVSLPRKPGIASKKPLSKM